MKISTIFWAKLSQEKYSLFLRRGWRAASHQPFPSAVLLALPPFLLLLSHQQPVAAEDILIWSRGSNRHISVQRTLPNHVTPTTSSYVESLKGRWSCLLVLYSWGETSPRRCNPVCTCKSMFLHSLKKHVWCLYVGKSLKKNICGQWEAWEHKLFCLSKESWKVTWT